MFVTFAYFFFAIFSTSFIAVSKVEIFAYDYEFKLFCGSRARWNLHALFLPKKFLSYQQQQKTEF